jgi:hypothetical protein
MHAGVEARKAPRIDRRNLIMSRWLLVSMLALNAALLGIRSWQMLPGVESQNALTDERFCSDVNGDGKLDVSDPVTLLNYLFQGTSTPYCVAQGISLEHVSTGLQALSERMNALERKTPEIATGSYLGDGSASRLIDTGLDGRIQALFVAGRCPLRITDDCSRRFDYFLESWITPAMEPGIAQGNPGTTLAGPDFIVVGATDRPFHSHNALNWEYVWFAIVAPE